VQRYVLRRLLVNSPCQTYDAIQFYQLACCSASPMADSGPDAHKNNNLGQQVPVN